MVNREIEKIEKLINYLFLKFNFSIVNILVCLVVVDSINYIVDEMRFVKAVLESLKWLIWMQYMCI